MILNIEVYRYLWMRILIYMIMSYIEYIGCQVYRIVLYGYRDGSYDLNMVMTYKEFIRL